MKFASTFTRRMALATFVLGIAAGLSGFAAAVVPAGARASTNTTETGPCDVLPLGTPPCTLSGPSEPPLVPPIDFGIGGPGQTSKLVYTLVRCACLDEFQCLPGCGIGAVLSGGGESGQGVVINLALGSNKTACLPAGTYTVRLFSTQLASYSWVSSLCP